jgi:benzodiazapine receptor
MSLVIRRFFQFIISLGVCLLAGYIGSAYAIPMIPSWFAALQKPDFTPPLSSLVPIGTLMYVVLGLVLYLIWQADLKKKDTTICFYLFIIGLVLNVLWIYVFFGLQSPFTAFITMIMLLAILVSMIYQCFRVSILACLLLVPYLIFAIIIAIINFDILMMNPNLPLLVI